MGDEGKMKSWGRDWKCLCEQFERSLSLGAVLEAGDDRWGHQKTKKCMECIQEVITKRQAGRDEKN